MDKPAHVLSTISSATTSSITTSSAKIHIIVPVFNRRVLTERFLSCMRQQSFRTFELIVVDDGSTDGTSEMITERFPEVNLLHGDGNLWWTGATNVGVRYALQHAAASDAVLIINDDLEVGPAYLETLHNLMLTLPDTLIGSVAVDIDNPDLIIDGGTLVNWWTAKGVRLNSRASLSAFGEDYCPDVSVLTGRGTLIPVSVFHRIGLYNDKHYQQSGDDELPVRAKAAGYRLVVSYAAVVRMHTKASDAMNVSEWFSLADARRYFFGIKANTRLRARYFFAYDTAKNQLAFVTFLLCDLTRITAHFALRLRLTRRRPCEPEDTCKAGSSSVT